MSAKHKRPFYIFAAVAAVCCMVLVTGIRGSKADDSRAPVFAGSQLSDAGATLSPLPGEPESTTPGSESGASGGDATGADGDFDPTQGLDGSLTAPEGGDAENGSDSGVTVLPPFDVDPVGDETVPPATDDESDDKGRGNRGGKKDKEKDKVKDEHGNQAEAEAEADAGPDDEVDPDVYGVDEVEGDDLDEPTDDATP